MNFFMPSYSIIPLSINLGLIEFCNCEKFEVIVAPYFKKNQLS